MKKYIGDKKFYLMVLSVAGPLMIQNGITNFVSLLDNIMVGQIGTEQMSGVAIVNQLLLVFNLCIFGDIRRRYFYRTILWLQRSGRGSGYFPHEAVYQRFYYHCQPAYFYLLGKAVNYIISA